MGQLLFSHTGRISAKPYWIGLAIIIVISIASSLISPALGMMGGLLSFFIFLLTLYMLVCVMGKRRHDFGKSAWGVVFMFIFTVIAFISAFFMFGGTEYIQAALNDPELAQSEEGVQALMKEHVQVVPLVIAMYAPFVLFALLWGLKPGDPGENRYGLPT